MENANVKDINEMIQENEGLIHFTLKRYFYNTISEFDIYEDMLQIGRIALYKAIETYDENQSEFSTFAVNVIKRKLLNFVNNDLYKNFTKGGERKIHNTEGMGEDSEKTRDRTMGRMDDFTGVESEELLGYIKEYKDKRAYDIVKLLVQGFTYDEIGKTMNLTKQRVNQIIQKLRKDLIANKDELGLNKYDYTSDNDIIDNRPVIAFNEEEDIELEFDNYIIASMVLGCNKYTVKRILINKKESAWCTCTKKDNMKLSFKLK